MRDLFDDKLERAINILKAYQPRDRPYYGCFSGGKDSIVIKEIGRLAGIDVAWHYNATTIDPPELVRFIKREHGDVIFNVPERNFFEVAKDRGFPTRRARWCCQEFKESRSPSGSTLILGVRAAESARRRKAWKEVTAHTKTQQYAISPIIDWSDVEVWSFIKGRGLPYCVLYDQGFKRLGCVGCPMSYNKGRELDRWPHFDRRWRRLFHDVWNRRTGTTRTVSEYDPDLDADVETVVAWFGDRNFADADEMYDWWRGNDSLPEQADECQGLLDFYS